MRPRRLRRLLAAVGAGAILAGTGIGWAARAEAAPNICNALAVMPTVGTVEQLGLALMSEGWSPEEAGQIVVWTVHGVCPEYMPVIDRFIAAYSDERWLA